MISSLFSPHPCQIGREIFALKSTVWMWRFLPLAFQGHASAGRAGHAASGVHELVPQGPLHLPWVGSALYFNHCSSEGRALDQRNPFFVYLLVPKAHDSGWTCVHLLLWRWRKPSICVWTTVLGRRNAGGCTFQILMQHTEVPWTQHLSKRVRLLCVPCIDSLNYRCCLVPKPLSLLNFERIRSVPVIKIPS